MASSKVSLLIFFSRSSSSRAPINSLFIFLISSFAFQHNRLFLKSDMSPTGSIFLYESQLFRACGTPTAASPDFHGNLKINCQTHQCDIFLIESAWSSLLINGHTVIIICCQFTTKFFLFLDWPVGSDFYQFANASGKIFFLSSEVCQVPES